MTNIVQTLQLIFLGAIAFSTTFLAIQAPFIACTTSFCLFPNGNVQPKSACVPNSGGQPYTLQGSTNLVNLNGCMVTVLGTTVWGPRD